MEIFTEEEEESEVYEQSITSNSSPQLDENGFPLPQQKEEEDDDDESIVESKEKNEDDGGFASDFYRSGTDWSSLLPLSDSTNTNKQIIRSSSSASSHKRLKQTNLFQSWGLKQNTPEISFPDQIRVSNPSDKKKSTRGTFAPRKTCPFYKKIPGTPFTVDAFRYGLIEGCSAYFLTHFHYDHYGGLTKGWSNGPIYCTPLTARLLKLCLSVNPSFINPLELDTEYVIHGIKVTMLEANHCPGAALIFFHLADGRRVLHTGDFRACKLMQSYPLLVNQRIHSVYLDTTYCNAKYTFPPIEDVLGFVVKVTKDSLKKQPKTLVIVGAYSIGKERVYLAISEALGVNIYTNAQRRRILQSFDWPVLSGRLSSHAHDTPLHVLPISSLRHDTLNQYLESNLDHYRSILAFRPTGWTYSGANGSNLDLIKPTTRGNVTIYGVPYSEHSSFLELREFVQFLRPEKIIPTVNIGNASQRDKMQNYFREIISTIACVFYSWVCSNFKVLYTRFLAQNEEAMHISSHL
ncbi:hypothetical protein MKW98_014344 [Papaver atlanticum]|uniref:Metallo-beta-lactamase domain-containing protein n=1 Tax=Papaver atlanticum TaxID=357466 RepID=A0AAD4SR17_9MAGN|nr:hypothetical protein MKW98_014344 [Papaver atlanticum]